MTQFRYCITSQEGIILKGVEAELVAELFREFDRLEAQNYHGIKFVNIDASIAVRSGTETNDGQ